MTYDANVIREFLEDKSFDFFSIRDDDTNLHFDTYDNVLAHIVIKSKVSTLKDEMVSLPLEKLLTRFHLVEMSAVNTGYNRYRQWNELKNTIHTIQSIFDPNIQRRIKEGVIEYGDIPVLFQKGVRIISGNDKNAIGGEVISVQETDSFFGKYYSITFSCIVPTSRGCVVGSSGTSIGNFEGKIEISKLHVRPITDREMNMLEKRGRKFREFAIDVKSASYVGDLVIPGFWSMQTMRADGRVMIDPAACAQMDSNLYRSLMRECSDDDGPVYDDEDNNDRKTTTIEDKELWRCYPKVQGFSLRLKRWGWLYVNDLSPVNWRDNAFDSLVMEPKYKNKILHLVKNFNSSFTDFIEGKSGGLIFLLHGVPGAGKSLCAESVAEYLHRPLYSVGVGELGTDVVRLEENLRQVLDLAHQWNAVLLLDEADIFMEKRDTNNIERNAMVSVFLRLLEYYSGVLFLTTNRVESFDPAFFSRISLPIEFPGLNNSSRAQVWQNILKEAGEHSKFDFNHLGSYDVNGRNIRTAVRIAQTSARGDNRPVNHDDLVEVLELMQEFAKKL